MGWPPFGYMLPASRMVGPATSPALTRARSGSEVLGSEPRSHTVVKPHLVSMSRIGASSADAGALAVFFQTASVKWTWLFQKPATTVLPAQSMTRASCGMLTALRLPIAAMTPLVAMTTAFASGAASGDGY